MGAENLSLTGIRSPNRPARSKSLGIIMYICTLVEVHTECWWGNLREGDNLEDPGVDGR